MRVVRYSPLAEADLLDVAKFTVEKWGVEQADRYVAGLEGFCELLAGFPKMGRECNQIYRGLRRMEHESHVIFFFPRTTGFSSRECFIRAKILVTKSLTSSDEGD